jgi:phosphate transport system substrate-binding protein
MSVFSKYQPPVVEKTGTGGGINLFCAGSHPDSPEIVNASRPMKTSEKRECHRNGINEFKEIKIGYDGIILAHSVKSPPFDLTLEQLFKALAMEVSINNKWVKNPYKKWSEISPHLPDQTIKIFGPPATSGTREAFDALVLKPRCRQEAMCQYIREDGAYIEMNENTTLIVEKLVNNLHAIGIMGFRLLDQNEEKLRSFPVDSIKPTLSNILSKTYPLSRALYVYFKTDNKDNFLATLQYLELFTSETLWNENGELARKGLIPPPKHEREKIQKWLKGMTP